MSETLVHAMTEFKRNGNILEYLGTELKSLNMKNLTIAMKILKKLSDMGIDEESSVAILSSYEKKFGQGEDISKRLEKFDSFIHDFKDKQDLISTAENMGMLSKEELEEQAKETGNWIPLLKRSRADDIKNQKELVTKEAV